MISWFSGYLLIASWIKHQMNDGSATLIFIEIAITFLNRMSTLHLFAPLPDQFEQIQFKIECRLWNVLNSATKDNKIDNMIKHWPAHVILSFEALFDLDAIFLFKVLLNWTSHCSIQKVLLTDLTLQTP